MLCPPLVSLSCQHSSNLATRVLLIPFKVISFTAPTSLNRYTVKCASGFYEDQPLCAWYEPNALCASDKCSSWYQMLDCSLSSLGKIARIINVSPITPPTVPYWAFIKIWRSQSDSNAQPSDSKSDALSNWAMGPFENNYMKQSQLKGCLHRGLKIFNWRHWASC